MPADIYQAQDPDAGLTPLPSAAAPTQGFQAMQQFASEGDTLAYRLARARDATVETQAQTKLALAAQPLRQQFARDTDFTTAPQRYAEAWQDQSQAILGEANKSLDPPAQARLAHTAAMLGIAGSNEVHQQAFSQERSTNVANWQTAAQSYASMYVNAKSDAERGAAMTMAQNQIGALQNGGWVSPSEAENEFKAFSSGAQEAYVGKVMQTDPAGAKAMLNDPAQLSAIPQNRRIALENGATAAVDETGLLKLSVLGKMNPAAAQAAVGRILPSDGVSASQVFEKGIIPQESGGDNSLISPAGALGLSQLMPATARGVAKELGMNDVAALSADDLQKRLLTDSALNHKLGLQAWSDSFKAANGYLPQAMAGYNSSPANAAKWMAAAQAKFGDTPTPAQYASVIPIQETRDYISKVYARLGAPMDAFGLTGNAQLRAQNQTLELGQREDAQFNRVLEQAAAGARSDADQMVQVAKDGYAVDQQRWSAARQTLSQAASIGNAEAAQTLRLMNRTEAVAPISAAAWKMPPGQLADQVSQWDAQARGAPATQFEFDRLNAVKKVAAASEAMRKSDPVGLGERQGLYQPVSISPNDIGTPAFSDALAARGAQAQQSAAYNNAALSPFHPEEALGLQKAWGQMGPDAKASLAATMAANLKDPATYQAAMKQVAGDNRLDLTAGLIAGDSPDVARRVLVGADMLKEKGLEAKVAPVRDAMAQLVPENLYPNFQVKSDLVQAGLANYAAKQGGSGAMIDPSDRAGQTAAIEEVAGTLAKVNGRVTPVPRNSSLAEFSTVLQNVTAADLKPFGGVQPGLAPHPGISASDVMNADALGTSVEEQTRARQAQLPPLADRDATYVAQTGQLMPMGLGSRVYQVLDGKGRPVYNEDGKPLRVDYDQLKASVFGRLSATDRAAQLKANQDAPAFDERMRASVGPLM